MNDLKQISIYSQTPDFYGLCESALPKYKLHPSNELNSLIASSLGAGIVFCGATEEDCVVHCKRIIELKGLRDKPLVLVGFRISELTEVLGRYLSYYEALSAPADKSEIASALERVLRAFYLDQDSKQEHLYESLRDEEKARAKVTVEIAQELESVPRELLTELKEITVRGPEFEAKDYLKIKSLEQLEDLDLIDSTNNLRNFLGTDFVSLGTWEQTHLVRTAFVTSRSFKAFDLSENEQETLLRGAFYLGEAFRDRDPKLLGADYFRAESRDVRTRFSARIKDAALMAALEYGEKDTGNNLSALSRLVKGEYDDDSPRAELLAGILLVSELIDRVCYPRNHWDASGAYKLLRKLKSGFLSEIHPKVWAFAVKFLSEAITSRSNFVQLPKRLRLNPDLLEKLMTERDRRLEEGESRVPIVKLKPGMTLSQPLTAVDGRTILEPGFALDEDLVWRIWQLAAVRPLNAAIVSEK